MAAQSYLQHIIPEKIVVVDDKGRQHLRQICFCSCEAEAATLLRYSLWPSSPKRPQLAFHIDLLTWLHGLQMESQVSVKSFCDVLHTRLPRHQKGLESREIKDVYSILIKETMNEFRHFWYKMENLYHIDPELDDGTACAACFEAQTRIYSFDADFQLVRKQSAGRNWDFPKHEGHFFLPQQEVDEFMASYNDTNKKGIQIDCNEFQAGNNIRAKIKTAKLSETAVFGSTCRHEVPKYFFSLKHGERLGYSVYLLKKLTEENPDRKLHILYDIACLLDSHLKRRKDSLLERISLAIPIFHCYGHKLKCQILYSPRRMEGLGLTDGESLERLWSYLGRFSKITKEMTPENRVDILAEGLHHYGRNVQAKFHVSLVKKHEKAKETETSTRTALSELLSQFPTVTDGVIEQWALDEKASCTTSDLQDDVNFTPQEEYAVHIEILENTRKPGSPGDSKIIAKSRNKVQKLEKELNIQIRPSLDRLKTELLTAKAKQHRVLLSKLRKEVCDRTYLLELIKKYARGQGIASRLQRQIKSCTLGINKTLTQYNDVGDDGTQFPVVLLFDDIKKSNCKCYELLDVDHNGEHTNDIPQIVKKQAVGYFALIQRALEEQELVKTEMFSVIDFHKYQHSTLWRVFSSKSDNLKSVVILEGIAAEIRLQEFQKSFHHLIGDVDIPSTFIEMLGLNIMSEASSIVQEILDAEDLIQENEDSESEDDTVDAELY